MRDRDIIPDWENAFDDLEPGYWESHYGGPDDRELERWMDDAWPDPYEDDEYF